MFAPMHISKTLILLSALLLIGFGCDYNGDEVPAQYADTESAAATQPAGTPYVDDTSTDQAEPLPENSEEENRVAVDVSNTIAVGEPNPATPTSVIALPNGGAYEAYSESKLANAETGDVVLFFHAAWCPSCRALENDIQRNADDIPDDLTILKLDYDTESALKKKYGVRSQHSLVQVDADGNLIQIWRGGNRLSDVVKRVE